MMYATLKVSKKSNMVKITKDISIFEYESVCKRSLFLMAGKRLWAQVHNACRLAGNGVLIK